jgi:curved DNA-binding protein CbpA
MDARDVLGIPPNAQDKEIRAAYLRKVKEFPPDRSPEEFERIRDAYETLRDPRRRVRELLFSSNPETPFATAFAIERPKRRFAGPDPWLAVLRGK